MLGIITIDNEHGHYQSPKLEVTDHNGMRGKWNKWFFANNLTDILFRYISAAGHMDNILTITRNKTWKKKSESRRLPMLEIDGLSCVIFF